MVCGLYPWAYAASGREPNLVYMHHTARADTEEWFTGQTRDTKSGGGGAVRFRLFIHPCTVYLLNGEGDLALGRGSINHPLRRMRHVVTQWYVLLFLIMCAYGLAVYNVK